MWDCLLLLSDTEFFRRKSCQAGADDSIILLSAPMVRTIE